MERADGEQYRQRRIGDQDQAGGDCDGEYDDRGEENRDALVEKTFGTDSRERL